MGKNNVLDGLTNKDLVSIHNAVAANNEDIKKVSRFASRDVAVTKILALLKEYKEKVVRLREPDYVKRGSAANRFPFYQDGMLASEFVAKCVKAGHSVAAAKRDLRYDAIRSLIELV